MSSHCERCGSTPCACQDRVPAPNLIAESTRPPRRRRGTSARSAAAKATAAVDGEIFDGVHQTDTGEFIASMDVALEPDTFEASTIEIHAQPQPISLNNADFLEETIETGSLPDLLTELPAVPQSAGPGDFPSGFAVDIDDLDDAIELDKPERPISDFFDLSLSAAAVVNPTVNWLAGAATDRFNLADILASDGDAMILGNPSDIVSSISTSIGPVPMELGDLLTPVVEPPAHGDASEPLARRASIKDFLGGDIAGLLGPEIILRRRTSEVAATGLSPFEHFVLQHIDGQRSIAEVQTAMRVSDGDLRIVLALLLDKRLVEGSQNPAATAMKTMNTTIETTTKETTTIETTTMATTTMASKSAATTASAPATMAAISFAPSAFERSPVKGSAPRSMGLPGQATPQPGPRGGTSALHLSPGPPPPTLRKPAPAALSRGAAALRAGLLIAGDHTKAAALHAQCIRELKNGSIERAHQLAKQAASAAPDMTRYSDTLADWPTFVTAHHTPADIRLKAQAVTAEDAGDFEKAMSLLRQAVAANPANASAWNRLAILLVTRKGDVAGAMDAVQRAVELVPEDATYLSNFSKFAALAEQDGGLDKKARGLWNRIVGK